MNRYSVCCLCFLLILFSNAADALPGGEIVFVHPLDWSEIWISNVDGTNARQLFPQTFEQVHHLSVQKGGDYILAVAEEPWSQWDIYLFDLRNPKTFQKNLTKGRFDWIEYADISKNGDVAFGYEGGLYLIKSRELVKREPAVEKLLDWEWADAVEWAPNGQQIVFSHRNNLYLFDIVTKEVFQIGAEADDPAFSPNGKQIAFSASVIRKGQLWTTALAVTTPHPNADVNMLRVRKDYLYRNPVWSPDGRYIAYVSYTKLDVQNIEQFQAIGNFVIPATGGEPEPILLGSKWTEWVFEWVDEAYPVEPDVSLVTTWGKLKTQ